MAQNDYAILVGISRYADDDLHPLDGPLNDVKIMRDWLLNEQSVPEANIKEVVSNVASPPPVNDDFPPILQDYYNTFLSVMRKDKNSYIRRNDARLYLYFSGHGFSEKNDNSPHAALYVGNTFIKAGPQWNIFGTAFADWVKGHGLFKEVVLIMDCCRDAEITKVASEPLLPIPVNIGARIDVQLFQLYATPLGGKAQERPIPSRNNEVHGLLTHAFLDAVKYAAPGSDQVTTADIKSYLEQRWSVLCGGQYADKPITVIPDNGEICFKRGITTAPLQRFKLKKLKSGDTFEIRGNNLKCIALVTIGDASVEINCDEVVSNCPIEDGIFSIPLLPSFYLALGNTLRKEFQAGGGDVEL